MGELCLPKKLGKVVNNEYEVKRCIENYFQQKNRTYEYSQKEFSSNFQNESCTFCGIFATQFCARCKDWYCTKKCQQEDWPRHRKYCKSNSKSNKQFSDGIAEGNNEQKFPSRNAGGNSGESLHQQRNGGHQRKDFHGNSFAKKVSPRYSKEKKKNCSVRGSRNDERDNTSPNEKMKSPSNNISTQILGKESKYFRKEGQTFNVNEIQGDNDADNSIERQSKPSNSDARYPDESKHFSPCGSAHMNERVKNPKDSLESFEEIPEKLGMGCEENQRLSDTTFEEVMVQVILGPGEYWVQFASNIEMVCSMSQKMDERKNVVPLNLSIGTYCMAKFADMWCRAKITSLKPKLKIFFIDFGNEEIWKPSDLLPLPNDLKGLKSQAIRIKLAPGTSERFQKLEPYEKLSVKYAYQNDGVAFVYVEGETNKQPIEKKCQHEVMQEVHNISLPSLTVLLKPDMTGLFQVVEYSSDREFLAFLIPTCMKSVYNSLFDKQFQDELDNIPSDNFVPEIGDVVMAKFPDEGWVRAYVLYVSPTKETTVASCDFGFVDVAKKVQRMPTKCQEIAQFVVQCSLMEKSIVKGIETFQGNFHIEHSTCDSAIAVIVNDDHKIQSKIELKKWVAPYELYQELKCVELKNGNCVISSEMSPVELYIRPMTDPCIETYNQLLQDVAKHCFMSPPLKYHPKVGQVLAAKFTEDGKYYRAVVLEVLHSKGVKVQYIDFGNIEYVPVGTLKPLSAELRQVECCAIKVTLDDVADRPLNEDVQNLFKKLILGNVDLKLKLTDPRSNKVQLFTKEGISLNEKINKILLPGWKKEIVDQNIYTDEDVRIENLKPGTLIDLVIMSVIGNFIVVRPEKSKTAKVLKHDLQAAIEEHCEQTKEPYTPRDKELCLAYFENTWWRSLCISGVNPLSLYRLDVGDVINVSHEHIRRYRYEFNLLPAVGIRCEIKTKDKAISENIEMYFSSMKVVTAKVVQQAAFSSGLKGYVIIVPDLDEYLQAIQ